ncbi:tetratricopeptide repeat protein [Candidatus Dojkabacteria bacterium]|jgi:tetratricopeptide (TPR) repeat protein|nr:tetratricopeptide repeat protein [Candidatus Dojkabacteria bacterium]
MPEISKRSNWLEMIENIEKIIFYASLIFIPISILPLPWDLTEYSMGLTLAFFSLIIITIELVKLVWKGRLLVPKGIMDIGILAVTISVIISTVFSVSIHTSLFGFDFRLGSGALIFLATVVYLFSVRSFLFTFEEVVNSAKFLIIGTFITSVLSILSFYGMNVLSFAPSFKYLFTTGLPLYSSSRVALVIWGVSLILSIYFAAQSFSKKSLPFSLFAMISSIVHIAAITLFSLTQDFSIYLLIVIILAALNIYILVKTWKKSTKAFQIILIVLTSITVLFFVLSRIPLLTNAILGKTQSLITQLSLSNDTSLKITTQTLSQNIGRGIWGMGQDTFSIAYNQFRPLDSQTLIVNATNFTNANNQIFNTFTNRGLIGLFSFVILAFFIFKYVYLQLKSKEELSEERQVHLLFIAVLSMLFLSSFFIYSTFLINFLLILFISLSTSINNMIKKDKLEVYVINWGIFSHTSGNQSMKNMALGVTTVFVALGVFGMVMVGRLTASSFYAIKAETTAARGRELQTADKLSDTQKQEMLISAANDYAKAISLNEENDVIHRRAALVVLQYLDQLAKKYNKTDVDADKKTLFDQIATYIEISVEESKKATELGSQVYANWSTRSSVYSQLVGLGLSSYTKSALSALQSAASLNPLNYEVYYNAAQLYILNNETDTALRTLNQLFSINPSHIPSLILAGEISMKDKDLVQAARYFGDAKKVMEDSNSTTNDVYDYVTKRLKEIAAGATTETTPEVTPNTNTTTE